MDLVKNILLVEDDPTDVMIFKRGLKKVLTSKDYEFVHANHGAEALEILNNNTEFKPDIIICDINMPTMNGRELLAKVKEDETLKSIPFLMLTTSEDENDIKVCFATGASGYFKKQMDFEDNLVMLKALFEYWQHSSKPKI